MTYNHLFTNYWMLYGINANKNNKKDEETIPTEIKVEDKHGEQQVSTSGNSTTDSVSADKVQSGAGDTSSTQEEKVTINTDTKTITLPSGDVYKYMTKCIEENSGLLYKQLNDISFTEDEIRRTVACAIEKKDSHAMTQDTLLITCGVVLGLIVLAVAVSLILVWV